MDAHELIAPYALDALDADERDEFEAHLRACERCRAELPVLREAAAAMAFAAEAPPPPDRLRGRILDAARAERSNVVPIRPWRTVAIAAAGVAAAAAAVAIGLGLWGQSLSDDLKAERAATALLSDPNASTVSLEGADGRLVVGPTGQAALVVLLEGAPRGMTYEAWVIRDGEPAPAGVFDAEGGRDVLVLDRPVSEGATVAVTLEPDGGGSKPTGPVLFSADVA
jgi:anti-sigma-K factor RskA